LIGLLLLVVKGLGGLTLHDDFVKLHDKYGKTFAYHVAGQPFVATTDPKIIEHFLKSNFDNYIKGQAFRGPFTSLLGDGIFNVDGDLWYHQRKVASKMFTKKSFETHIFQAVTRNAAKVRELLMQSKGQQLCMFELMNRFTLDTIGEIGFSKNIGSLENPNSPFLKSFDFAQQSMIKRFWAGQGAEFWKVLRFFGLLWEGELPGHINTLNKYCNEIVDELVEKVSKGDDNSFVGLFIKDPEGATLLKTDEKKFRIYIRDMVLNFLLAGRDTTAQCLTWTIFELAQSPDSLKKARAEVQSLCGDMEISYKDVANLKYIEATLKEGLRLHPSVPMDGKVTVAKDTLPNGIVIPAGCRIQYDAYAQGRSKEIWGEDASTFRPCRWAERTTQPTSFEFTAFHAGPRECLGKRLAMVEMVCFIAGFVRDFNFELAIPASHVKYDTQLTLGCSSGLPMKVTARQ